MADESNIFLEEDGVRIVGAEASPVLDIEGGNNWNLSESDGDVRIGDEENMLKMGVSLAGGGAGNGRIQATSDLRLGSSGDSILRIDTGGLHPHRGDYSLGSASNPWNGIGTKGDPALTAEGDIFCSGTVFADKVDTSSDQRLKDDIETLEDGLDAVLDLRPVSYTFRDNGDETRLGLVGQEVADVLPDVVSVPENGDEYLRINYMGIVPVLIDAIQEQHEKKEALAERATRQKEQLDAQADRIDDLEERLAALE